MHTNNSTGEINQDRRRFFGAAAGAVAATQLGMIDRAAVVVDGLDNLVTRLILNSACVKHKIPYIYAGVSRLRGMITTIIPGKTPCLACFYPEGFQGEGGLGVLGVIPALIANFQVLESIKILTGQTPSFAGKLLRFNGNDLKFRIDEIKRNEACKVCSPR